MNGATVKQWTQRDLGKAEITQKSKTELHTAATANHAAAGRWKALAAEDVAAAGVDLKAARELLKDLTAEIAPIARLEFEARAAVDKAKKEHAARLAAARDLGVEYKAAVAGGAAEVKATGARAVLDAAAATKKSVDAQQAFHDARADWAADNLLPVQTRLDAEKKAKAALDL